MNQIGQRRRGESYGMINVTLEKMKESVDE